MFQSVLCFALGVFLYFLVSLILHYFYRSPLYQPEEFVLQKYRSLFCYHGLISRSLTIRFIIFLVVYVIVYALVFSGMTFALTVSSFAAFYFICAWILSVVYYIGALVRYFRIPAASRMQFRIPVHFAGWNMFYSFFQYILFLIGC